MNELGEGPIPDEDPDAHIFNSATKGEYHDHLTS